MILLTTAMIGIAYTIGWNWEFIPKLMLLIIAFITCQNSFLLSSNKNLYNAMAYTILTLYILYIGLHGKFKDSYILLIFVGFGGYAIYIAIKSMRYYIQQKKMETEIFMNIRDDIQNTKTINIPLFSNIYGLEPAYLRSLILSYLEDGLITENIRVIDE